MFILSFVSRGLGCRLVNLVKHTSIYENSGLKVFEKIIFWGKISNNWPKNLLGANVYKAYEFLLIIIVDNFTMD